MLPTVFEIVEISFKNYKEKFKRLFPLLVVLFLVGAASNIIVSSNALFLPGSLPRKQIVQLGLSMTGLLIVMTFITYLILHMLKFEIDKKHGILAHASAVAKVFVPTLVVSVITGIISGIGTLVLIIPGIIFFVLFFFSQYYTLFENVPVIEAIKRSYNLTKDRWGAAAWRLFGPIALIGALSIVITKILNFVVAGMLFSSMGVHTFGLASIFISSAVSALFYPWIYGAPLVLFVTLQHAPKK